MKYVKVIAAAALRLLLYVAAIALSVLIIRVFLFNFYVVPSDSMEPTLLPGDFMAVNKGVYGARLFTRLRLDSHGDPPMVQAPGLRRVRRGDVVAFNFPYHRRQDTLRMHLDRVYVKRCIGLPGDSVSAVGGLYRVAGLSDSLGCVGEQQRLARLSATLSSAALRAPAFPASLGWDMVNFGPFYVPAAGESIALTPENIQLYRKLLVYEARSFTHRNDSAYIDGAYAARYTFRSSWYFMAGDKAFSSMDSRHFGLIPEAYIIGKAGRVLWSRDVGTGELRRERTMKRIR